LTNTIRIRFDVGSRVVIEGLMRMAEFVTVVTLNLR